MSRRDGLVNLVNDGIDKELVGLAVDFVMQMKEAAQRLWVHWTG